jgi:hypothetical protein
MFLERHGVFNSGDFGIAFFALLGARMDEEYRRTVNHAHAGRRGSLAVGMHNGGGYHAIERNNNKTAEGRLTIRPVPSVLPGLQFSFHGVVGAGNTAEAPPWKVNLVHVSFEHERGVLACQLYRGEGDFSGKAMTAAGSVESRSGFSVFGEARFGSTRWSAIVRHDSFERETGEEGGTEKMILAGLARRVGARARLLLDYERTTVGSWSDPSEETGSFRTEFRF